MVFRGEAGRKQETAKVKRGSPDARETRSGPKATHGLKSHGQPADLSSVDASGTVRELTREQVWFRERTTLGMEQGQNRREFLTWGTCRRKLLHIQPHRIVPLKFGMEKTPQMKEEKTKKNQTQLMSELGMTQFELSKLKKIPLFHHFLVSSSYFEVLRCFMLPEGKH